MNPLNELIQRNWIIKNDNKDIYRDIKRNIPEFKKFLSEQLGWNLIINEKLIKLEKIPAYAHSFMGIQSFSNIRDYYLLCTVLMYLEDREDHEQFLLSEIVNVVGTILSEYIDVDWLQYEQRKSLIRVMNFCVENSMLIVHEESQEGDNGFNQEALYENTGYSRYFATNFQKDITGYKSYLDFETNANQDVDEDKGHYRVNRLYRQLITCPAIYFGNGDNTDALYIRNQRQLIQKYLTEQKLGTLQFHKNAVFLVLEDEINYGLKHPSDKMISEIVLLVCAKIRSNFLQNIYYKQENEVIAITNIQFSTLLRRIVEEYNNVWTKEFQSMDFAKLEQSILEYMVNWMFIEIKNNEIWIFPATGKIVGKYLHVKDGIENE